MKSPGLPKSAARVQAPPLVVSIGCPAGIGPEVAVAAAAKHPRPLLLVGDEQVIRLAARRRRVAQRRLVAVHEPSAVADLPPNSNAIWLPSRPLEGAHVLGKPSRTAGAAQLAWIDQALALVAAGDCCALVTGPVSKRAIASSGGTDAEVFTGHTEHLARKLAAREVVMAFAGKRLLTALVTTHLPLSQVPEAVTRAKVATTCFWLAQLALWLGCQRPRVAVAALNPHAGEGELLGQQERQTIRPAMAAARRRLRRAQLSADLLGPLGAETAFRLAANGEVDAVVAMYHDQATIASKLLGFGATVNVSLGLPIVRTSVDHGTAYDLAAGGRASAGSMVAALALAEQLSSSKP